MYSLYLLFLCRYTVACRFLQTMGIVSTWRGPLPEIGSYDAVINIKEELDTYIGCLLTYLMPKKKRPVSVTSTKGRRRPLPPPPTTTTTTTTATTTCAPTTTGTPPPTAHVSKVPLEAKNPVAPHELVAQFQNGDFKELKEAEPLIKNLPGTAILSMPNLCHTALTTSTVPPTSLNVTGEILYVLFIHGQ